MGPVVSSSVTVYRLLLRLRYRRDLRDRYGPQMADLFAQDLEDRARRQGIRGIGAGWRRALVDLARRVPGPVGRSGSPHGRSPRPRGLLRGTGEDVGFAWRALRREPSFFGSAVLVLGSGVALNAAVFAIVNAYLVRPLPYPEPDRLVTLRSAVDIQEADAEGILEKSVSWDLDAFTLVGDQGPELALGAWVATDFFQVYGVEPVLGRSFTTDEGIPGSASVAMIGYGLWQERYGGTRDVLGRTFSAYTSDRPDDAESFTIVGVLPADFWHFNDYTGVLAPLRTDRAIYAGRLVPGMPPERAGALLTERVVGRSTGTPPDFRVEVVRTHDQHVARIRPTLMALQSAVLLVFLIACANVAVLVLVRSARREHELGVRRALGAGQGRLGRQLVAEGSILTALAGAAGLGLGWLALEGVKGMSALPLWRGVPGGTDALRLDSTVVLVTLGLCLVTGVVFGLVPLLTAGRQPLSGALGAGGRGTTDTTGRRRARSFMVGAEVALSLALLAGAGLMVRSAINLQDRDLGFDPTGVMKGQLGLREASYPDAATRVDFFEAAAREVEALPGVEAVGLVSRVPFTATYGPRGLETERGSTGEGVVHVAGRRYFETMGIEVVRGRSFTVDDASGAPDVVVVSETLARDLWPGQDPIGRRLRGEAFAMSAAEDQPWATVIGVVGDVAKGVRTFEGGDIYWAHAQSNVRWMNLVVRSRTALHDLVPEVENVVAGLDPDVPLSAVRDVTEAVASAVSPSRFLALLFGVFAGLALVLAVVGLYGVMAYAARQARKDVAIRMTLGAGVADVRRLFLRDTLVVLGLGLAAGLLVARALGSALEEQLHGIEPGDPGTLAGVAGVLAAAALAATWLPVRRASSVEPMKVLREE